MSELERKRKPEAEQHEANATANAKRPASAPISARGSGGDPRPAMYRPAASAAAEERNTAARETVDALDPNFDHSFDGVAVHADATGDAHAKAHGKPAVAEGSSIYLGQAVNPRTAEGRQIIGHEMVHVVQQTGRPAAKESGGKQSIPADYEHEAHRLGDAAAEGARVTPQLRTVGPMAQGWSPPERDSADNSSSQQLGVTGSEKLAGPAAANDAARQILNPPDVNLTDADIEVLKVAIDQYINTTYDGMDDGLKNALVDIKEPQRPERDDSLVLKILGQTVESLTELGLDYASEGFFGLAKSAFGHSFADAAKATGEELGIAGGNAIGGAVEKKIAGNPSERGEQNDGSESREQWVNPGAASLVDEFATRQRISLREKRASANVFGAMIVDAGRKDRQKALQFAQELQAVRAKANVTKWFTEQVIFRWMTFSAQVAAGKEHIEEAGLGDLRESGAMGVGAITIRIDAPGPLSGLSGLSLKSITADGGPGVLRFLRNINRPLTEVPVLREVYFTFGESKLDEAPAIVLYPSGGHSLTENGTMLLAIGKMAPLEPDEYDSNNPLLKDGRRKTDVTDIGVTLLTSWLTNHTTAEIT